MPKELPKPVIGGVIAVAVLAIAGGGWYMVNKNQALPAPVPPPLMADMKSATPKSIPGLALPPAHASGGNGVAPPPMMQPGMQSQPGMPPGMGGGMPPGMAPGSMPPGGMAGGRPGMPGGHMGRGPMTGPGGMMGGMPGGMQGGMPTPGSMSPGGSGASTAKTKPTAASLAPESAPKDVTIKSVDPSTVKLK